MIPEEKYNSMMRKLDYLTWFMHNTVSESEHRRWLSGAFYNLVGYYPNLRNPKTFNEKICWLRLNYCSDDLLKAVDKVEFKKFIETRLGAGYTACLYGVYDDAIDIDFEVLPEKFVLKSSFSSASNNILFVTDKHQLDTGHLRYQLSEWLQPWNSSAKSFSNWYRGAKPRILAEELLEVGSGEDLRDYKFWCFNGEPKLIHVAAERFGRKFFNYFDVEWSPLPFEIERKIAPYPIERPSQFQRMYEIAKELARDFVFVRVDFYQVAEKIIIGELTFSPGGGLDRITPEEWDHRLGALLTLPTG